MDVQIERQAPCMVGCPVHTDTREFVERIVEGRYEAALDLLLAANPFTSVCGRICHHPCEEKCRRGKVDAPVGLRPLKRFIVESTREYRAARRGAVERTRSERVAIVGSGPGGLTAAHDLVRAGFGVTVFESGDQPGGMLGTAIPRYRLPYAVLQEDIEDIRALGVEIVTRCTVGKHARLSDLQETFAAVLLATGLSESRGLGVPGIDSHGVLLALPLLRAACAGNPPALGDRVVVIGGGNVAIDVARCARRLGARDVTLACLESREEMPGWEWEIQEAIDEGVKLAPSWGPRIVVTEKGAVSGIELKRCVRVFDDQRKFAPAFDDAATISLPATTIVLAIGQRGDLTCVQDSAVAVEPGERLAYDRNRMCTSERGVFACGEVVAGPGAAVEAVADGHRAARAVQHFLETGDLLDQPAVEMPSLADLPQETVDHITRRERIAVALNAPDARVRDFGEIERAFTETEARAEAQRCLACTTGAFVDEARCAGCLTCVRVCPFGVATVSNTAAMPAEKCQACGLCAAQCPAAAIALKRFGVERVERELRRLLNRSNGGQPRPLVVSFCCLFETTSRRFVDENPEDVEKTGIARVLVPCVGRLSVADMLAPFEMGADAVCVIACASGECMYPTAEERLSARVDQVKRILDEIGIGGERVDLWRTKEAAEVSWSAFWEVSKRKSALVGADQRG